MDTQGGFSGAGTAMYLPPEAASNKFSPNKRDVYSLGATFVELMTNLLFWYSDSTPLTDAMETVSCFDRSKDPVCTFQFFACGIKSNCHISRIYIIPLNEPQF